MYLSSVRHIVRVYKKQCSEQKLLSTNIYLLLVEDRIVRGQPLTHKA